MQSKLIDYKRNNISLNKKKMILDTWLKQKSLGQKMRMSTSRRKIMNLTNKYKEENSSLMINFLDIKQIKNNWNYRYVITQYQEQ